VRIRVAFFRYWLRVTRKRFCDACPRQLAARRRSHRNVKPGSCRFSPIDAARDGDREWPSDPVRASNDLFVESLPRFTVGIARRDQRARVADHLSNGMPHPFRVAPVLEAIG
jgi:hypothetical protein